MISGEDLAFAEARMVEYGLDMYNMGYPMNTAYCSSLALIYNFDS